MKNKDFVHRVTDHILTEIQSDYDDYLNDYSEYLDFKDWVDIKDFVKLKKSLLLHESNIKSSSKAIEYFKEVKDGYNQDTKKLIQEIHKNIDDNRELKFDEVIKEKWVVHTITKQVSERIKKELLVKYNSLMDKNRDEYLIFQSKFEPLISSANKIECLTDFSRISYILMKLDEFGYIRLPRNKNDELNRVAIAEIFQSTFETGVSNKTIKDYIGSKLERSEGVFEKGIENSNPDQLLKIPPFHKMP